MNTQNPEITPLRRAKEAAGSWSAMAEALGVSSSAPSMWEARGCVPAEYCPSIERLFGVRCEVLRPDVEWVVLRGTKRRRAKSAEVA